MKRNVLIVASAAALCAACVAAWLIMRSLPATQQDQRPEFAVAVVPDAAPPAIAPAEAPAPREVAVVPAASPAPAAAAAPQPSLTAETLKGSRWKEGMVDVEFMPDGQWKMNGRICAKWEVEGNRVKIFDDKGEVHYVDIVGDTIAFNGQKIARLK